LVTGGAGFVGTHLVTHLRRQHPDWDVVAATKALPPGDLALDVTDLDATVRVVKELQPTLVAHLAAVASIDAAEADRATAWDVNFGGILNMTEALRGHAPESRLLFVSTAQVYGLSESLADPLSETAPYKPSNVYAAAKAAGEILVRQAGLSGLRTVVARPFNHTGPGQTTAFAVPAFAAQVARIEAGLQPPEIHVGNLDDARDFLDVRDVVSGYALLLSSAAAKSGSVYNIASGRPHRIGDVLDFLISKARVPISVRLDPARIRPGPPSTFLGDASAIRALGWRPQIEFETMLEGVLDEQRNLVQAGAGPN
jgi:GDP-4-dehydro-6-deoxy-D-mannose reductase